MRNLIMAGLMATSLLPAAAQAQWIDRGEARELRGDRRDIREERRDLNQAYRHGDRRDIHDARADYRDARREYAQDYRDARRDWRPRYGYDSHSNYSFPRAGGGQRWVRARYDLLLINKRNGHIDRVIRNYYR